MIKNKSEILKMLNNNCRTVYIALFRNYLLLGIWGTVIILCSMLFIQNIIYLINGQSYNLFVTVLIFILLIGGIITFINRNSIYNSNKIFYKIYKKRLIYYKSIIERDYDKANYEIMNTYKDYVVKNFSDIHTPINIIMLVDKIIVENIVLFNIEEESNDKK